MRRGTWLRGYAYRFIESFVPTLTREVVDRVLASAAPATRRAILILDIWHSLEDTASGRGDPNGICGYWGLLSGKKVNIPLGLERRRVLTVRKCCPIPKRDRARAKG